MTDRQKTLLRALYNGEDFNHKAHYSQFCKMWPYVEWCLGTAFITEEGRNLVESW